MLDFAAHAVRALALAAGTAAAALSAHAACQISQIAEIPVTMAGRQPFIDGQINGQDVRILIDTGATLSTMIGPAAKRLGLTERKLDGITFQGVGGSSKASYVSIDKLKLGKFTSSRAQQMLVIGHEGPISKGEIEILLGADFFAQADVEFDLAHSVVRLMRLKDCAEGEAVYWGGAYAVEKLKTSNGLGEDNIVEVMVNGKRMDALLDTGATHSVLSADGAQMAGIKLPADGKQDFSSGIGKGLMAMQAVKLDSFAFDQEKIQNPRMQVGDLFGNNEGISTTGSRMKRDVGDRFEMLLGADFFLAHRVFIARSEKRVYVTYNGGPIFEAPDS